MSPTLSWRSSGGSRRRGSERSRQLCFLLETAYQPQDEFFLSFCVDKVSTDYHVVLQHLPWGVVAFNTCFLHCNVGGRPYGVQGFQPELESLVVLKDTRTLRSYQMITCKCFKTKRKVLAAKELVVKGKPCFVLDPSKDEVHLKIHWVAHHLPYYTLRKALGVFKKVKEVSRDHWHIPGIEHFKSTTRIVRMTLKPGMNL